MGLKDILVHLEASPRRAEVLGVAGLAARHGAHLTGLHIVDLPPPAALYGFPSVLGDVQPDDSLMAMVRAKRIELAGGVAADFNERVRRDGLTGEWCQAEGDTAELLALHARYVDLVVVGQPEPGSPGGGLGAAAMASLMQSGRPLLVVPFAGEFGPVGRRVLVGWNASPQAARALNDAIPLLRKAETVTVLSINPRRGIGGVGDLPAADIALHLARHGVAAQAAHSVATEIGEGDALLSYAADIGADLLVCGMYGHSRLREFVFGGVTRSLLAEMTLPVLMAH